MNIQLYFSILSLAWQYLIKLDTLSSIEILPLFYKLASYSIVKEHDFQTLPENRKTHRSFSVTISFPFFLRLLSLRPLFSPTHFRLVEPVGIEPTTPCVQGRCSPS